MDRTAERILIESFQVTVAGRFGSMGISKAFYCHLYHRILACFLILSITASVKQYALSFKCVTTLTTKGGSKLMMMREVPSKVSDLSEEVPQNKHMVHRRMAIRSVAATATTITAGLLAGSPRPCAAALDLTNSEDILRSLKDATPDQPQIPLPQNLGSITAENSKSSSPIPIVEGLISLKNPRSERRPTAPDEVFLITVESFQHPDAGVLAGAKFPFSKIRGFPFQFQLYPQNILPRQQAFWDTDVNKKDDLLVQVVVCKSNSGVCADGLQQTTSATTIQRRSGDGQSTTITSDDTVLRARGVAKLLRLNDRVIRAPVSLPLE